MGIKENPNTSSADKFDKEFFYLYETCVLSKQKIYIGKYLLKHRELFKALTKCRLLIIDALFQSAAINLCKISDSTEQINVVTFGNKYRKRCNKQDKKEWNALKPQTSDLEHLQERRNKSLAHSDRENIEVDIESTYPLYIETLERVAKASEKMLDYIYRHVKSASILGVDKSTGESFALFDSMIQQECEAMIRYAQDNAAIQKYMKENHPEELLSILYSKGETNNNEQTENAHAE